MQFNASKIATIEKSGSWNAQGWRDGKPMHAWRRRLCCGVRGQWLWLSSHARQAVGPEGPEGPAGIGQRIAGVARLSREYVLRRKRRPADRCRAS
ncbi:hypothetical protein [Burkholderia sp. BCC1644]|uniref:hypothetical protein n=1 Tax=Burkholderia sp. BCC1644 TaxID=2676293 RepID=UPI00159198F9|nr:hypothetical protein [Burkholderia sp. BCC1644]